jgi:photosystem II stability/assembly factor-like uncharacterized protein
MFKRHLRFLGIGTVLLAAAALVGAGVGHSGYDVAGAEARSLPASLPPPPTPISVPVESLSEPRTPPFEINTLPSGGVFPAQERVAVPDVSLPDLNVRFIQRTPAYAWDQPQKWPAPGEPVTFTGHIANRGGTAVGSFAYAWAIDGASQPTQTHPGLAAGAESQVTLSWLWQTGVHSVALTLDPSGSVTETFELNNKIEDRTNGLSLGIYVEQAVYDFFNENVWQSGWGGNSFDDWIQRHVTIWNQMFATAVYPLTPGGVIDRVRLDKVVRVPDGGINCNPNFPADDKTIDLIWGFLSEMVGVPSTPGCPGWTARYRDDKSTWDKDLGILHELSHARYLIDLYGMNVHSHEQTLTAAVDAAAPTIQLSAAPDDPEYQLPAYLIVNGEIILCTNKAGNTFTNCLRGHMGTTPRSHAAGSTVHADRIFVQDGLGNALAGGPAMPASGGLFYREQYDGQDLMISDIAQYGEHSAMAWNRIAGQRPVCGNYTAPCNLGEYLNDIPDNNLVEVRWPDGSVIPTALVEAYQARPYDPHPTWYGKSYTNTADLVLVTDSSGRASLGAFPLGSAPPVAHGYGFSNAVLLLKIVADGRLGVQFLEVTRLNLAYWSGDIESAVYPVTLTYSTTLPVAAPQIDFTGIPISGTAPFTVSFTASNTGGPITAYLWDFGDGATSTQAAPSHKYVTPGIYRVSLQAIGLGGADRVTKANYVTVTSALVRKTYLPLVTKNYQPPPGRWTPQSSGTSRFLKDLFFVDAQRGWVVGDGGTILHTANGGSTWISQTSGVAATLEGISCVGGMYCWAVGDGGRILKTTNAGALWTSLSSGTSQDLDNVQFIDLSIGYAVGRNGTILKTVNGGTTWLTQTSGTTFWLWGTYFLNQNIGWASGGYGSGVILRTSDGGNTWTSTATANEIADVYFVDANRGWAVTNGIARILRSIDGGATWATMKPPGSAAWLTSVNFVSATEGWVTGAGGTILYTADAGATWTPATSGVSGILQSVYFAMPDAGWAVGESGTILKHTR